MDVFVTDFFCSRLNFGTKKFPAIRVATQWYQNHLGKAVQVILVTNDRENKRKALEEGISAETG